MEGIIRRVLWEDSEVHHVIPYASGGKTDIRNAALVHRDFHPKSSEDVREFKEWWNQHGLIDESTKGSRRSYKSVAPSDGTKIKMSHRDKTYFGEYQGGKIVLTGESGNSVICSSLSEASKEVTKTSRNGWRDWHLMLPGRNQWVLADDWRKDQ